MYVDQKHWWNNVLRQGITLKVINKENNFGTNLSIFLQNKIAVFIYASEKKVRFLHMLICFLKNHEGLAS